MERPNGRFAAVIGTIATAGVLGILTLGARNAGAISADRIQHARVTERVNRNSETIATLDATLDGIIAELGIMNRELGKIAAKQDVIRGQLNNLSRDEIIYRPDDP